MRSNLVVNTSFHVFIEIPSVCYLVAIYVANPMWLLSDSVHAVIHFESVIHSVCYSVAAYCNSILSESV